MKAERNITEQMIKFRDTAREFLKDQYEAKLKPYKYLVKAVMKANEMDPLPALLKISETQTYANPMNQMMFMAATVEIIEESKESEECIYRKGSPCIKPSSCKAIGCNKQM